MSQRQPGFNGGIQSGTTAGSTESGTTEQHLRQAAGQVRADNLELKHISGLSSSELKKLLNVDAPALDIAGVYPDGGIWVLTQEGVPLVAAEAKRQGAAGNAIERWFKNYCVLKALGVRRFVTICTGDGFFNGNSAQRTMQLAVLLDRAEQGVQSTEDIWNTRKGRLWTYRFETASAAGSFDLAGLLQGAVDEAVAEENVRRGATS